MTKFTTVLFLFFTIWSNLTATEGLDYLNALRSKTGMSTFNAESHLDTAASNHSYYMQINNIFSHNESSADSGFTGVSAWDRAIYAGYHSRYVSENISYGSETVFGSIDGLFSAIYHRFGFLNPDFDEVGIGINGTDRKFYTYNMGNSLLDDLCKNATDTVEGAYYSNICDDLNQKIPVDDYNNALSQTRRAAPDLIIWPSPGTGDIPPVFYEEIPDPLPGHSVTGYPVSVEFNVVAFNTPPAVNAFTLTDNNGNMVTPLTVMDSSNDPNDHFIDYQHAFFPEKRLEWGERYYVHFEYSSNDVNNTNEWCFSTRSLASKAERFYRIENDEDIALDVVSGSSYSIYIVPNNTNDKPGSVSYGYNTEKPDFSYIDSNTVYIKLSGNLGNYANFEFSNGQKISLTIASDDTASLPKEDVCPVSLPLANAGNDLNVSTGTLVQLDGSASSDPNANALSYNWTILGKPTTSNATLSSPESAYPTFIADVAGEYILQLTVTTVYGETSIPDTIVVYATAPSPNVSSALPAIIGYLLY